MNKQEETDLILEQAQNKGLKQSAKNFMNGVLAPLKGRDVGQLVEEYTSQMTLVAEGLSEDQEKLTRENEKLAAQQTQLEQQMLDGLHDADVTADELRKQLNALEKRLDKAEKLIQDKKVKKVEGFTGLLRQATWLAAVIVGGWIIVTIINFFK
ncbi:MAG: hypothetical protein IKP32_07980 [Clostridia bacterium]|nr:hypothetical protein [Clostridia bacterium]